eukprot:3265234-Pyramimonas_sp.AAC.1
MDPPQGCKYVCIRLLADWCCSPVIVSLASWVVTHQEAGLVLRLEVERELQVLEEELLEAAGAHRAQQDEQAEAPEEWAPVQDGKCRDGTAKPRPAPLGLRGRRGGVPRLI